MITWAEKEKSIQALERNGEVSTADLIEEARNPKHPCHGDFTWNVQQAAEERWHDQARKLIRKCGFKVVYLEMTQKVVRYVPLNNADESHTFKSLSKMRSVSKISNVLQLEVNMLYGNAKRTYGIALSKENIVGKGVVDKLGAIVELIGALKEDLQG